MRFATLLLALLLFTPTTAHALGAWQNWIDYLEDECDSTGGTFWCHWWTAEKETHARVESLERRVKTLEGFDPPFVPDCSEVGPDAPILAKFVDANGTAMWRSENGGYVGNVKLGYEHDLGPSYDFPGALPCSIVRGDPPEGYRPPIVNRDGDEIWRLDLEINRAVAYAVRDRYETGLYGLANCTSLLVHDDWPDYNVATGDPPKAYAYEDAQSAIDGSAWLPRTSFVHRAYHFDPNQNFDCVLHSEDLVNRLPYREIWIRPEALSLPWVEVRDENGDGLIPPLRIEEQTLPLYP